MKNGPATREWAEKWKEAGKPPIHDFVSALPADVKATLAQEFSEAAARGEYDDVWIEIGP